MVNSPITLDDFVGPAAALAEMRKLVLVLKGEDQQGPRRVLVTGKPGCGKHTLAQAAATDAGVECVRLRMASARADFNVLRLFREARAKTGTVMVLIDNDRADSRGTQMLVQECASVRNGNLVIVLVDCNREDVDARLLALFTHHVPVTELSTAEMLELVRRM